MLLEIVAFVVLVFWVALSADRRRRWPAEVVLPAVSTGDDGAEIAGGVAAIIPARDEAEVLPQTLPGLLAQEDPHLLVFLVDDGSTDRTREVAIALAESAGTQERLHLVDAGRPEAGWSGKVHAQASGYRVALEEFANQGRNPPAWIVLSDADIRHREGSIRALWRRAVGDEDGRSFDLVSVMARLRAQSFWEKLIVPAFVYFFQLLYPFRRIADGESTVAAAAGGCVLVRREALEKVGGFTAVGREIIDDVALGKAVKRSGGRVWLGLDAGILSVRRYTGLGKLWRMVSRTAFTQLRYRWDLLILTLLALGVFLVLPPSILVTAGWRLGTAEGGLSAALFRTVIWALAAWVVMALGYLPAVRHHGLRPLWALTLPMAGLLFGLMTLSSALDDLRGRGPSWRGRDYRSSRQAQTKRGG